MCQAPVRRCRLPCPRAGRGVPSAEVGQVAAVTDERFACVLGRGSVGVEPADGGEYITGMWFGDAPDAVDEPGDVVDRGDHIDELVLGGRVEVAGEEVDAGEEHCGGVVRDVA